VKKERQHVTVGRWEDAVSGTSQKTCHVVLLSLREVGGGKSAVAKHFISDIVRSICQTLNAEDYAFMELFEN
jgi:hypothetical protein